MTITKRVSEINDDNVEKFLKEITELFIELSKNEIHILLVHHGAKDILKRAK